MKKSIAVVTSTIGRAELEDAILSVKAQIYPCHHYVFVDGKIHAEKVKPLEQKYPDVVFTYLPISTGENGWTNSYINAMSAFVIKEDIICYLDDDNWYEPNHTSVIATAFHEQNIDVAFTYRKLFEPKTKTFICNDNSESTGFWKFSECAFKHEVTFNDRTFILQDILHNGFHVDTNCLALSKETAQQFAAEWVKHKRNDRYLTNTLFNADLSVLSTGKITVNYNCDLIKQLNIGDEIYALFNVDKNNEEQTFSFLSNCMRSLNEAAGELFGYPWIHPYLFKNKELQRVEMNFE